jgi:hypothetical protein
MTQLPVTAATPPPMRAPAAELDGSPPDGSPRVRAVAVAAAAASRLAAVAAAAAAARAGASPRAPPGPHDWSRAPGPRKTNGLPDMRDDANRQVYLNPFHAAAAAVRESAAAAAAAPPPTARRSPPVPVPPPAPPAPSPPLPPPPPLPAAGLSAALARAPSFRVRVSLPARATGDA